MKTQYIAQDGKFFEDAARCAQYELASIPGMREKLYAGIECAPLKSRWNWCRGGACACSGCINRVVHNAGFSYEHWKIWEKDNPKELNNRVDVWVTHLGLNRIPIIQLLASEYKLSLHVAKSLLGTLPYLLAKSVSEAQAETLVRKFNSAGASVQIEDCR